MPDYLIDGKWQLSLPDVDMGQHPVGDDTPYLYFLQHKMGDIAAQTGCYMHLIYEYLTVYSYDHVVEYFGGVGIDSTIIHHMLQPAKHTIMDLNESCVDVLRQVAPWADVRQGDFYRESGISCDLAILDINRFTMLRAVREERLRRAVLDSVSASGLAIVADSSIPYFHLNKGYYAELCGQDVEIVEDYFEAFSKMFWGWLGFGIVAVAYHSKAAYMLLFDAWEEDVPCECRFVDRHQCGHLFRRYHE